VGSIRKRWLHRLHCTECACVTNVPLPIWKGCFLLFHNLILPLLVCGHMKRESGCSLRAGVKRRKRAGDEGRQRCEGGGWGRGEGRKEMVVAHTLRCTALHRSSRWTDVTPFVFSVSTLSPSRCTPLPFCSLCSRTVRFKARRDDADADFSCLRCPFVLDSTAPPLFFFSVFVPLVSTAQQ
jgi:hypothetical protein